MRDFLRFLFSAGDQANIDLASIVVEDIGYAAAPDPSQPYPQAMRVFFRTDPTAALPQVRPLFPGKLRFIADPGAPGIIPTAGQVNFTPAAYAGWQTLGTLHVSLDPKRQEDLRDHAPALEVLPNLVWYSPVRITSDFLFVTLRNGLRKDRVPLPAGGYIGTNHVDWAKHAIAGFLAGRYTPSLNLDASASADDVITQAMPDVELTAVMTGDAELVVTAAFTRTPQDAPDGDFDALGPGVDRANPAHPAHGVIPARHIYRSLRNKLIDATPAAATAVLSDWPQAPRYFALRFTRTWQSIENCSVHFPAQRVRVEQQHDGTLLAEQRLPAHGVFYLKQDRPGPPPMAVPGPPQVRLSLLGEMRWLNGATPNSWRTKAATQPLDLDLAAVASPHICVRRPMSEEIMAEPEIKPGEEPGGENLCTYLSMRRSVRALVNNRICGGRLSFGRGSTSQPTSQLMANAWSSTGATARLLAHNQPPSNGPATRARTHLEPILSAFFPTVQAGHTLDDGKIAYNLWQTIIDAFQEAATRNDFDNAHIGRGAAGALVSTQLASAFEVDPIRNPGESDDHYFDRVVGEMLAGVEPGAAMQFWRWDTDFQAAKSRNDIGPVPPWRGHSPLFVGYTTDAAGNIDGITVIDQFGESDCPIERTASNSRRIAWHEVHVEIWTASNWDE
jgi:hypothetical protein